MQIGEISLEATNEWRSGAITSAFTPGADEVFALHAERIGNAIDVIEEADNLGGVMDGDIIKAGFAQRHDVGFAHLGRRQRQFFGEGAERPVAVVQGRCPPIARDGVYEGVRLRSVGKSFNLGTEVMRVRLDSIDAVVGFADDDGEHFALPP